MTLRVLTGLLLGLALALGLHPISRGPLLESFRPAPSPEAMAAPFSAFRLPTPDDPQAASAWMMAWLAERYRGNPITEDQLLLLTEIAQAGEASEPNNAYWLIFEGLLQHDLGNDQASERALKAALRAPGFKSHSTLWAEAVLRGLRQRDGGSRPVHLLAASDGIKAWLSRAIQDPHLAIKIPEATAQLWIEGCSRIEFPTTSSLDEAAIAQVPLALAQSLVFWGASSTFLALILMHKSFNTSRQALSSRLEGLPIWIRRRASFAPLMMSATLCVVLGGPGRIMLGVPRTPAWLLWMALAAALLTVVAASSIEEDPDSSLRPGWTSSSCSALTITGGVLLLAASLWAHPFSQQLEQALRAG